MNAEPIMAAALAAATGVAAAQLAGPMTLGWPAGPSVLRRRMDALTVIRPGRLARLAGAGLLVSLLVGGALAAYAAAPSAPEHLPSQVAGVTGSGDALSLQLKDGAASRSLKVGDTYEDGWILESLTPSQATLVRNEQRRQIGLGPTGALASSAPTGPPSQVRVLQSDEELLAQARVDGKPWDGKTPRPGLTLAETRRYFILKVKGSEATAAYINDIDARSLRAGTGPVTVGMSTDASIAALGAETPEYAALLNRETLAKRELATAAYDRYGPVEVSLGGAPPEDFLAKLQVDYPGSAWIWRAGQAGGSDELVMRPPDPQLDKLVSTEVRPIQVTVSYLRPGGDANNSSDYVEGPPPP